MWWRCGEESFDSGGGDSDENGRLMKVGPWEKAKKDIVTPIMIRKKFYSGGKERKRKKLKLIGSCTAWLGCVWSHVDRKRLSSLSDA